jgi:hypothetical protein
MYAVGISGALCALSVRDMMQSAARSTAKKPPRIDPEQLLLFFTSSSGEHIA